MDAVLHPTEVCKSPSCYPFLTDELTHPIPTCRKPPLGLPLISTTTSLFSTIYNLALLYTDPSRMDTDEDGVTDYIELQGWDIIVIHERRGEVMEDRCNYGVWSLPIRYDSEEDGASDEIEWKFHGDPGNSDSDKDGIPDREEPGPNLTMVEGTPPSILDKKGRDAGDENYGGAYISAKVKVKIKLLGGVAIKGKIVVKFKVTDNGGLDKAVIYVQTGGSRVIYLGGNKSASINEEFDIGDILRLIHGGFDVKVNVTDINGNWATGKTHIDSALESLKKGLMALLEIFKDIARVIAKVASMLIEVIRTIIRKAMDTILKPLKKAYLHWKNDLVNTVNSTMEEYDAKGFISDSTLSHLNDLLGGRLYYILMGISIAIMALSLYLNGITLGSATIIMTVAAPLITMAILAIFSISEKKDFSLDLNGVSLSVDSIWNFVVKLISDGDDVYTETKTRGDSILATVLEVLAIIFKASAVVLEAIEITIKDFTKLTAKAFAFVFGAMSVILASIALVLESLLIFGIALALGITGFVIGLCGKEIKGTETYDMVTKILGGTGLVLASIAFSLNIWETLRE